MIKPLFWLGIGLLILGLFVLTVFVVPHMSVMQSAPSLTSGDYSVIPSGPTILAVAVAGVGLAGGFAAIGIGLGKWKRPRTGHDGTPEV